MAIVKLANTGNFRHAPLLQGNKHRIKVRRNPGAILFNALSFQYEKQCVMGGTKRTARKRNGTI
jgi:hypothetical protein